MMYPLNHRSMALNGRIGITPCANLEQWEGSPAATSPGPCWALAVPALLFGTTAAIQEASDGSFTIYQAAVGPTDWTSSWKSDCVTKAAPPSSTASWHLKGWAPARYRSSVLEELTARDRWALATDQERKINPEAATLTLHQKALGLNVTVFIVVRCC